MSRNAQNRSLKHDVINEYGFWAMLAKYTYINLKMGMSVVQGVILQHIVRFLKIFDFVKLYKKISFFLSKNIFFYSEIAILKTLYSTPSDAFYLRFDLNRYKSKRFREN